MSTDEIWVVPALGPSRLFPCLELCKILASRNHKIKLIISSKLSSFIASSLRQDPLIEIIELPSSPSPPPQAVSDPFQHHRAHLMQQLSQGLESLLSTRPKRPDCAISDVMMMDWTSDVFKKFDIRTIGFYPSGGCAAALEYATWKANPEDKKPGEILLLPGLPKEMGLTDWDLKRRPYGPPVGLRGTTGPPGAPWSQYMGPSKLGEQPPWIANVKDSIAMMINTYDDLECPFIEYLASQIGTPVLGVGPLLPEQFWNSAGSLLHDVEIRTNQSFDVSVIEDKVIEWLDLKPRGSVLYVSFDSEVGPIIDEYQQLADALEASNKPFIWVIQPGSGRRGPQHAFFGAQPGSEAQECYFPRGFGAKVGDRGLIIRGWAPHLVILSHPSMGGFVSHCRWNSTVEAIGRGVPILAWPIEGDQYYNAKLVVKHLKVGYMISDDLSQMIKKDDIMTGIERLIGDENVKKQAARLSAKFQYGFPASSMASLDAFEDLLNGQLFKHHCFGVYICILVFSLLSAKYVVALFVTCLFWTILM